MTSDISSQLKYFFPSKHLLTLLSFIIIYYIFIYNLYIKIDIFVSVYIITYYIFIYFIISLWFCCCCLSVFPTRMSAL